MPERSIFKPLFFVVAFRENHEVVPFTERKQRLFDSWNQLDLLFENALAKPHHVTDFRFVELALGKILVALPEGAGECTGAIPVNSRIRPLDLVERGARFGTGERRVVEEIEKLLDSPLEVDVVLPERVVRVDDEVLSAKMVHVCEVQFNTMRLVEFKLAGCLKARDRGRR